MHICLAYQYSGQKKKYFLSAVFFLRNDKVIKVCVGKPRQQTGRRSFVTVSVGKIQDYFGGTE